MLTNDIIDVTIIGGGAAGLLAAIEAGKSGLRTTIVDRFSQLGGQLGYVYPTKALHGVPGYPFVFAQDYLDLLIDQLSPYSPEVCLNQYAREIQYLENGIIRLTTDRGVHHTRTVILACGQSAFLPACLDTASTERLIERGIYFDPFPLEAFTDRKLLISGGGDNAVDTALHLSAFCTEIAMVYKTERWQALGGSAEKLARASVTTYPGWEIVEIEAYDSVSGARLINSSTGEQTELPCQAILTFTGLFTDLGVLDSWGLKIEGNGIVVNANMATNLPFVYAIGDIARYPGKQGLIAWGAKEATIAISAAAKVAQQLRDAQQAA